MTIIENKDSKVSKELNEDMSINFDKLRRIGSLSGWQRQLYNFIIMRMGPTVLEKFMGYVNDKSISIVPEDVNPEETKEIIKLALIDFIDSSL